MDKTKTFFKSLCLSVLAGAAISLGGILFLNIKEYINDILAAYCFSVGLILVVCYKFWLFTGKIGYVLDRKFTVLDFIIMFIGNLIGAVAIGYLCRLIGFGGVKLTNEAMVMAKLDGFNIWKLLLSGLFCGMFVYAAVDTFQIKKIHLAIRLLLVVVFIGTFVVLKLNHCIANMFYFSFANAWGWKAVLFIVINTVGNAIGAIILDICKKVLIKATSKKEIEAN